VSKTGARQKACPGRG